MARKESAEKIVLTEREYRLLVALQENPMAKLRELKESVGVSIPTIRESLRKLRQPRSNSSIPIQNTVLSRTLAEIKHETLGLEVVDVLITASSLSNVQRIEEVCNVHLYTGYRVRAFGKNNGIFAQFRIPKDSLYGLRELLDKMVSSRIAINYEIIAKGGLSVRTQITLDSWDYNRFAWNFDWNHWVQQLYEIEKGSDELTYPSPAVNLIKELDIYDIIILEELSTDANRSNTDILTVLNKKAIAAGFGEISLQTIGRRKDRIEKNCLKEKPYRAYLNGEIFDLYNTVLFVCRASSDVKVKLYTHLKENPFPFDSVFRLTDKGFQWYFRVPPSHFSEVYAEIWQRVESMEVHLLDYHHSQMYGLWHKAYDPVTKQFKTDRESLLSDAVISLLKSNA